MILQPGEDLLRRSWYSDEYYVTVCQGRIRTQDQAWEYFRQSIFMDHETDNANLAVQFSDDPTYSWTRMIVDLDRMTGKQYIITSPTSATTTPIPHTSPPQSYWLVHKHLKSASRPPRPTPGLTSAQARTGRAGINPFNPTEGLAILETFVILGKWVYQAASLADMLGGKLTEATNLITSSLDMLRTAATRDLAGPHALAIGYQRPTIWLSEPMGLPPDSETQGLVTNEPVAVPEDDALTDAASRAGTPMSIDGEGSQSTTTGKKRKRPQGSTDPLNKQKRQNPFGADFAIRNALASTRAGLAGILEERAKQRS